MPTDDLTGMSVSSVLAVLKSRQLSGELRVISTYRQVVLTFADGNISGVRSDRPADRLGLQMMKAGDIGVVDLHGALVEQHQQRLRAIASDTETSRLGEILVDRNVLEPDELEDALDRYVARMTGTLEKDLVLSIEFIEAVDPLSNEPVDDWETVQVDEARRCRSWLLESV